VGRNKEKIEKKKRGEKLRSKEGVSAGIPSDRVSEGSGPMRARVTLWTDQAGDTSLKEKGETEEFVEEPTSHFGWSKISGEEWKKQRMKWCHWDV